MTQNSIRKSKEMGEDETPDISANSKIVKRQTWMIHNRIEICRELQRILNECIAHTQLLINLYEQLESEPDLPPLVFETGLVIEPEKRLVLLNRQPVDLTRKEFDLLLYMASRPNFVFTREQLYHQIWDSEVAINVDEVVKSHIKTLRKKLSSLGIEHIKNIWGIGYCFTTKRDSE